MRKKFLLILFLSLFSYHLSHISFAQINNSDIKRTNHWYFGEKAGLDFSSGTAVADTQSQMMVAGNPVTMSDTAGNLLFYSNRYNVWNRNHQIMPNGTDLIKWGTNSFSHALCVPQPGTDNIYYIFYWEYDSTGFDWNMEYAVIDMNLDGGLGDVVSKRNFLMNKPTDGLTTVKHSNGVDFWFVCKKDTFFHSYLLTEIGLNTLPIISNLEIVGWSNNIKSSPYNDKIAVTITASGIYGLLNFDNSIGVITNPILFKESCNSCTNGWTDPYGIEFSDEGKKVYFSIRYPLGVPKTATSLYQVTIAEDSASTINSKILLDSLVANDTINFNGNLGLVFGIQLAANRKIYVTRNSLPILGAIQNPNADGLNCNYSDSVIDLYGRNAAFGLPNFVSNWFYQDTSNIISDNQISDNEIIIFPNPFSDFTTICISDVILSETKNLTCILHDVFGKEVKKFSLQNEKTKIYRNNLSEGIYLLNIQYNNQSFSQKLIITN